MNPFKIKKILSLLFLLSIQIINAQSHSVSGKITDNKTNESLLYADVYDLYSKKGTMSNAYGMYSLSTFNNKVKFSVSYLGYRTFEKEFTVNKDTLINIQLSPEIKLLDEVVINKSIPIHKQTLMGKINVPISTIKAVPSFVGETDLMKSLTFLPGISGGVEGYSNIFVRGGDRGQNLILLDGIKLYNTNHVGGFLSLFNSDILKYVDLYKGGFPARYGGRASSVIDIYTKDGNSNEFKGKLNLGVLTSSVLIEGPLSKKMSYYFAARSSYYDLFTLKKRKLYKKTGREGYFGYTIFDINSKINWELSDTNKLSLSFYTGHDYQSSAEEIFIENNKSYGKMRIHNTGLSINHFSTINPKLFLKNTLSFSNYQTNIESIEEGEFYSNYSNLSKINDFSFQSRLEYSLNSTHSIKTGIEIAYYQFTPAVQELLIKNNNDSYKKILGHEDMSALENNYYLEDEIKLSKKARLNVGVRGTIYKQKDTKFYNLVPRFSLRWLLNKQMSVKMNFTQMRQYNHALVNNYYGFEKEIWLAATQELVPQKSNQVSGGVFYSNKKENWKFSLESYYKKMSQLLEYVKPIDERNLNEIEKDIAANGKGESYGLEGQISEKGERFNSSLNYTLSWNYRQFDNLNNGKKYPFIFDKRHDVSLLCSYKLDDFYTLNSNFVLTSGKPVTLPVGYIKPDNYLSGYYVYDGINNRRLPLYHRLDLSLTRIKRNKKGLERKVSFNIYNVYARKNALSIYYDKNTGKVKQQSMFSIIPTINVSFQF